MQRIARLLLWGVLAVVVAVLAGVSLAERTGDTETAGPGGTEAGIETYGLTLTSPANGGLSASPRLISEWRQRQPEPRARGRSLPVARIRYNHG